MGTPQRGRRLLPPRSGRHHRPIVLLNLQAMADPTRTIAIELETVGDGATGVRGLRRVSDPTAPSALLVTVETAEMAGRPDIASHGSGTERHILRSRFLLGRVRPI